MANSFPYSFWLILLISCLNKYFNIVKKSLKSVKIPRKVAEKVYYKDPS